MTTPSPLSPDRSPEQTQNDEKLSQLWQKTASQPWHEYMRSVQANQDNWAKMQSSDDAENEASKKRVQDYLTKHKHLF